jgi:AbrB family looped-hinge helix DNA binding protein
MKTTSKGATPMSRMIIISSGFRVTIPMHIRTSLGLKPGQKLAILQHLNRIEIIPMRPMKSMRGFLKGIDTSVPREGAKS